MSNEEENSNNLDHIVKVQDNQKTTKDDFAQQQLSSLDTVIQRIHTEANFTSKAFAGNLTEAKVSIRSAIQSLNDAITKYSHHLNSIEINNKKLEDLINVLAILPQKLEEKTCEIPINVAEYLTSVTAEIKNEILISQAKQFEELKSSFVDYIDDIKLEANEATANLNLIIKKSQQEMLEATNVISKSKIRNLLGVLIICICFSVFSSWLVNMYFPRLVAITKSGNVLIKDSKVLLPNDGLSYNEYQHKKAANGK